MPSRRDVLAGIVGFAGCTESRVGTPTPTASSGSTPQPIRLPDTVTKALADTRFEDGPVCPSAETCFHRLSKHADPDAVVVPEEEHLSSRISEGTMRTYNLGTDQLVIGTPTWIGKWTDIVWAPTIGPSVPNSVDVVGPGETLERTVTMEGRGDGLYAVVEEGYFGTPREPSTVRPSGRPRELRGDTFRISAIFEVEGSDWELTADDDVTAERDGETLVVEPDRPSDVELVLEVDSQSEGLPLVPESVAAYPPLKNAILGLKQDAVERVRLPTDGTAPWYLKQALVFPQDIEPDHTIRLDEIRFTSRVE